MGGLFDGSATGSVKIKQEPGVRVKSEFGDRFDFSSIPAAPRPSSGNPQVKVENKPLGPLFGNPLKAEDKKIIPRNPETRRDKKQRARRGRYVGNSITHRTGEFRIKVHFRSAEMQLDVTIWHEGYSSTSSLARAMDWSKEEETLFSKLRNAHYDIEPIPAARGWLPLLGNMVAGTNRSVTCQIRVRYKGEKGDDELSWARTGIKPEDVKDGESKAGQLRDPSFCFLKMNN
ncbi:hypothetical protein QBC35DRAFT_457707 [Podospora australis]|uniref:Uncharacterized protein n=1 Tax=Podospora australis TaxID=1536484 RepID=A0AAN6WHP5_9PEZI|nr:hypothetical protein QBC35DRAFT_457707 [Podospora australis]